MDKKRIFKGLITVAFFEFMVMPFTFLLRILYSRTLTVEDYGLFYAMINFFLLIYIFVDLGLGNSLTHYFSGLIKRRKYSLIKKLYAQVFIIQLFLSIIFILIVYFLRKFISENYFNTSNAALLIPIFGFTLVFLFIQNLLISFFMGLNKEKYYASMNPFRLIIVLVLSLIIIFYIKKNLIFVFSIIWVISYLLTSLFYIFIARKDFNYLFKRGKTLEKFLKPVIKYASMVILGTGAFFILGRIDSAMLTFFRGVREVGLYEVVLPISSIILLFTTPLRTYLFPIVSKLKHSKDIRSIDFILKSIYNLGFFFTLPITIVFFFFSSEIILIFFGKKFMEALIPLQILIIGFFFKSFTFLNFSILQGLGKVKKMALLVYMGIGLNIILNIILIPKQFIKIKFFGLGIVGAALSTTITLFIMFIVSFFIIKKETFKISYKNWWKILLLNMILYSGLTELVKIINLQLFLKIVLIILILGPLYLLLGYLWKIVDYKELLKLIKKSI